MSDVTTPLDARIRTLQEAEATGPLRAFAAGAALHLLPYAPDAASLLVDAAGWASRGEPVDLEAVRSEFSGAAASAGTIGMRHRCANAPAFLAAYYACGGDAYGAATGAARMVRLHAEFAGLDAAEVERGLLDLLDSCE